MMEINLNIIVINCHPYVLILIIFITIHMILNVAWENHVYCFVCEIRDHAAHEYKHSGGQTSWERCPVTLMNEID